MQLLVIQRILGLLLILFSSALLPPILVGLYYGDGAVDAFQVVLGCSSANPQSWQVLAPTRRSVFP